MSLVEQALGLLERSSNKAPALPRENVVVQPADLLIQRQEDVPVLRARDDSSEVPCRSDRTVGIDAALLRDAGLVAPSKEQRQIAAELRLVKRPLLAAMSGENRLQLGNVVAVTSALPGEGKTFTAINLALSLALERSRKVILVDGDVAKGHVTSLLELDGEPGLLDLGGSGMRLEETIVRTDNPSLYVLPAGKRSMEATEILRSEGTWSSLAALAASPRNIVVIDAPPLLVTSEASVVASHAGQVLLIVKAAETPQEAVLRAIAMLPEEKPVSLVLTQADPTQLDGYGYGYYGLKDYGAADDVAAERSRDPD